MLSRIIFVASLLSQSLVHCSVAPFSESATDASNGNHARCRAGTLKISLETEAVKLLYNGPENQTMLTATIASLFATGSTIFSDVYGGASTVKGTYGIRARLCLPIDRSADEVKVVQLLAHGGSHSLSYWDLPGHSYVDAAAAAGYATLAYDRLGAGASDRPDPIQVVQAAVHREISHQLTHALRDGTIDGEHKFDKVIATSHSSGAYINMGQVAKFPQDFDALAITGFTTSLANMPAVLAAGAYTPAALTGNPRFKGLPNGYYAHGTPQSLQYQYFHHPNYDQDSQSLFNWEITTKFYKIVANLRPAVFDLTVQDADTQAIGELFTLAAFAQPNSVYSGPVDVVVGEFDYCFCTADCRHPTDLSAEFQPALFPAASKGSQHYIVPGVGHDINGHRGGAHKSLEHIDSFLRRNKLAPTDKDESPLWFELPATADFCRARHAATKDEL